MNTDLVIAFSLLFAATLTLMSAIYLVFSKRKLDKKIQAQEYLDEKI